MSTVVKYTGRYGLPETGWYNVENGIQTFRTSLDQQQTKVNTPTELIRKYEGYGEPNGTSRASLIVRQPKNGIKGEFEVLEEVACKNSPRGVLNRTLLRGIMNEHGDVVELSKNEQFIEEMVARGKNYPNSIRRVAKKCMEFLKCKI